MCTIVFIIRIIYRLNSFHKNWKIAQWRVGWKIQLDLGSGHKFQKTLTATISVVKENAFSTESLKFVLVYKSFRNLPFIILHCSYKTMNEWVQIIL